MKNIDPAPFVIIFLVFLMAFVAVSAIKEVPKEALIQKPICEYHDGYIGNHVCKDSYIGVHVNE